MPYLAADELKELSCPPAQVEVVAPQTWEAEDEENLSRARIGCSQHFGLDAPCVVKIVKTGPLTYQVTCGAGQPVK